VFICGFIFFLSPVCLAQSGLDSLNDDALMNELASRGLNSLLERAFEVNKVPASERQGRRTLIALSRLSDPSTKLTPTERQQLVSQIIAGIEPALPAINDPNLLMKQAFVLITQSIERDVNPLEYWGENPRAQAALRPIVQAAMKILDRCAELAKKQSDELANTITSPNSPSVDRYLQLQRLAQTAEYNRWMLAYDLAISMDAANPDRRKIASDGIEYLKQFDVNENPDRGIVRNRIAKLAMAMADYDTARRYFASTLSDQNTPRPKPEQLYEAKYFSAVVEVLARKPEAAQKAYQDLLAWQSANPLETEQAKAGADAAAAALQYRIRSLESELARDPAEKKKADDAATAVLMDLLSRRPELRGVIYEQLLPKLDVAQDLKQLDPLMLRAIVSRGEQEIQKPATETADAKSLTTAIDAARELISRKGQPGVDSQMIDGSVLLIPFFLDRLGRRTEAAAGFIEYADQYKQSNLPNATLALNNAQAIIGELRSNPQTRDVAAVARAYEQFLPVAIAPPFDRGEFEFEYAGRLQLAGKLADAIRYYQLVPASDSRAGEAKFLLLLAQKQRLDEESLSDADRAKTLTEIQTLADQVNTAARAALTGASTDADRTAARSRLVRTSLLAADLARREQKNPQRAIELLSGFEESVSGLPRADELLNEAMYVRVLAYMGAGNYTNATQELVKLLNKTDGSHGAGIVYNLLEKLNADFDRAQQANDRATMAALAKSRAELSGFLVKWAADNKDESIRKYTYRYRVFDAETQRRAAELETDPAAREAGMKLALQRYQALQSKENLALYRQSIDPQSPAATDPNLYDPQVTFGIAQIQYDLGNYDQAAAGFSTLVTQRKLGVDTDQSWEAMLKLIRSNLKLNRNIEESKNYLKMQTIAFGSQLGGKKLKPEFDALRKQLIPDFQVEDVAPTTR
jgi:hypothetical protein